VTVGEAKTAIDLIQTRKASFGMPEPQKEFEADYVYELFLELGAKHLVGQGDILETYRIYTFSKDIHALNLPKTIHDQVFRMYYDYAHKHSDIGGTPLEFVMEIGEFADAWERRQEGIKRLGLERYNESVGLPAKREIKKNED
jgi:hypothetical protein